MNVCLTSRRTHAHHDGRMHAYARCPVTYTIIASACMHAPMSVSGYMGYQYVVLIGVKV
jgi:hypothetical protein